MVNFILVSKTYLLKGLTNQTLGLVIIVRKNVNLSVQINHDLNKSTINSSLINTICHDQSHELLLTHNFKWFRIGYKAQQYDAEQFLLDFKLNYNSM